RRQHVAMHWAATFGRTEVVKYLLAVGLDPASTDSNRMNLLHNATSAPHVELVRYLLSLNAIPLEGRNAWDGTVLSSMLYFATEARHRHRERIPAFVECLELLIAAGANPDAIDYIVGIPVIDSVLDRHRPRPQ
ncbi:MAG TPA: ankyrin repeat domain-containing protein, partial [Gemmatimonadaceae bacterium]